MGWMVQSVRMNRPQQEVYEKCGLAFGALPDFLLRHEHLPFPYVGGKRRGR